MHSDISAPIYGALSRFSKTDAVRFHMPGHKGVTGDALDVTELCGTDDLLCPSGAIKTAQDEAALAYGARNTFFCTCGSTAGVLAMLLSMRAGSKVLVPRDAHKSAYSGLALSGHVPVYVAPETEGGETGVVSARAVKSALSKNPDICAVLLTRPDYFGRCADIDAIAAVCAAHGAALLVDEAHGAHFALSKELPKSAAGFASMWVNSAHKTLPCPNQGAYLHCGESAPHPRTVGRALFSVHTTSPSFPLLAELDSAWRRAARFDYAAHKDRLTAFKNALPDDLCAENGGPAVVDTDFSRLVIDVSKRGVTGAQADEFLRSRGIFAEMADHRRVVAITSPIDPDVWYNTLLRALCELPIGKAPAKRITAYTQVVAAAMLPCEVMRHVPEYASLKDAIGRVAAEAVGVYPPGTAVVAPGEPYTAEAVEYLLLCEADGLGLFGAKNGVVAVV